MKKIYAIAILVLSGLTVTLFQNCSPSQFKAATGSNLIDSGIDTRINLETLESNFQINSSLSPVFDEQKSAIIYEYVIGGGMRPPCMAADYSSADYEEKCSISNGFRINEAGVIQRYFRLSKTVEYKYEVGSFSENFVTLFLQQAAAIRANNAQLEDQNPEVPPCMDAPTTTQTLFSAAADGGFVLAERRNCHTYMRFQDSAAVKLAEQMETLFRRLSLLKGLSKQLLLEKVTQAGFAPLDYPQKVRVAIFQNGRIVKQTEYIDASMNKVEILGYLKGQQLASAAQQPQVMFERVFELVDLEAGTPLCADAPATSYIAHFIRTSDYLMPPVTFKQSRSCHTFLIQEKSAQVTTLSALLDK